MRLWTSLQADTQSVLVLVDVGVVCTLVCEVDGDLRVGLSQRLVEAGVLRRKNEALIHCSQRSRMIDTHEIGRCRCHC